MSAKKIKKLLTYIVILSLFLILSCTHVAHDANVKEGAQASVMIVPPFGIGNDCDLHYVQGNLSYGYRLKNGRKFSTAFYLGAFYDSNDDKFRYYPAFDFYYQTGYKKPYGGFGFIAGVDPSLYYMWGNEWVSEDSTTSFASSYQAGIGILGSLNLQYKPTWYFKNWFLGPLIEYRYLFIKTDSIENSSSRYIRGHMIFVGLTLGVCQ